MVITLRYWRKILLLVLLTHLLYEFRVDGQEEDVVCLSCALLIDVGLYRSNVGVHEDHLQALLLQCLDGLCSGVIELSCLTDGKPTAPQQEHLLHISPHRVRLRGRENDRLPLLLDSVQKYIEQELGIGGATSSFWVELRREKRLGLMDNTLIAVVVCVGEQRLPVRREGSIIDGVAVVLGGDESFVGQTVDDRLVLTSVTEGQFNGLGT